MMEDQITHAEAEKLSAAKVWETGGRYAPTIGILGAVMGLIHVMANLSDSSKLGAGIAVAFVATVYGVGAANLLLIPLGNKLKKDCQRGNGRNGSHLPRPLWNARRLKPPHY